jgi:hypothetical protein
LVLVLRRVPAVRSAAALLPVADSTVALGSAVALRPGAVSVEALA